jgi:hypothetical protein
MNEQDYFDYFIEMGAMRPEEDKLKRKQAMVDYLRQSSLQAPEAKQAGRVVVAPSWTQVLGQVGQAYAANRGQKEADAAYSDMNAARKARLEALRAKRAGTPPVVAMPQGGKSIYEEDDLLGPRY